MIIIPEEAVDVEHLAENDVVYENETYKPIDNDMRIDHGYSPHTELWYAIFQRQSDNKYFRCEWENDFGNGCYNYDPHWLEVEKKTITKTVYKEVKGQKTKD